MIIFFAPLSICYKINALTFYLRLFCGLTGYLRRVAFESPQSYAQKILKEFSKESMSNGANHFYEFGSFRLDSSSGTLWRGDDRIALSPKASELLRILIE